MDTSTQHDRSDDLAGAPPAAARRRRWLLPALGVGAVLVAVILVWFQPQALLFDTVVDDGFPEVAADASSPTDAPDLATGDEGPAATDEAAPDEAGDEAASDEPGDEATDEGEGPAGEVEPAEPDEGGDDADDGSTAGPEATGPVALVAGSFSSRNRYTVTGSATVYELEDGSRTLRLEDFESTNGPDLFVYLTVADDADTDTELGAEFVDLGVLRGNVGNQNYAIPADVDLERFDTVVIWCRRFSSGFGSADLG